VGARIVLVSREVADAAQLLKTLAKSGAVCKQLQLLGNCTAGWQGNKQLKIILWWEALTRELANQLLVALYGYVRPHRDHHLVIIYKVEPGNSPVPIGRPVLTHKFICYINF